MIRHCMLLLSFCVTGVFAQGFPGNYTRFDMDEVTVVVSTDSGAFRFTFVAPEILRMDFLPSSRTVIETSLVVIVHPASPVPFVLHETDSTFAISSSAIRAVCRKTPFRISIADSSGRTLLREPHAGGFSAQGTTRTLRFAMSAENHFYGTGERGTALDKRGLKFESYNTQIGGYSTALPTMNLNVPFLATTNGYAMYIDNTYKGEFDLGFSDSASFAYTATGGELTVYVIVAPEIPEQLERYTWLTGRQPLPPRWIFGYIQSKNRYGSEDEARAVVRTMRERNVPCDALVLDLKWFTHMGDIAWDASLWPGHDSMVADFLAMGIKTILITEPYIVAPSLNFQDAAALGYLARDSSGQPFLLEKWWSCGGCPAALLDITHPGAQQWWWSKHPAAFGKVVAGIWTDLGEPERHPDAMRHALGSTAKVHNVFNLIWAKTVYEGFRELNPNRRVVNLTRSGFAGIQRYGVLPWSGDVARSFGGLAVQLPMLLNMGMSGLAYQNSDIGGYARMPTTPEIYVRWMEFGAFCPVMRAHGAGESVRGFPTEPWGFGAEAERVCRDFIRLRYQLLPYNYTLARRNYESGMPLARPLFWDHPADPGLKNESATYMWGESFLVSPVVQAGETTKTVLFPAGTWINFWTDEVVKGGRALSVESPLSRIPLFVKAGSIIPMAPVWEYSDQHPLDTLTLGVYPAADSWTAYTMYEDDGSSLEYQDGKFARTTFRHSPPSSNAREETRLYVGTSVGEYLGKPSERVYVLEVHGISQDPASITCNTLPLLRVGVDHAAVDGFSYDHATRVLRIRILCQADNEYEVIVSNR